MTRIRTSRVALTSAIMLGIVTALMIVPPATLGVNAQLAHIKACVILTSDGERIKTRCNEDANDLHVRFSGGAKIVFTEDGKPVSDPIRKPRGANDLHVVWNQITGQILKVWWTKDGERIGEPILPPVGANDLHLRVTDSIKRVVWTHDGTRIGGIAIPDDTVINDLHLVMRPVV